MTLSEILQDIHALQEDLLMYERKYNILTETFYESYMQGDEPPDDSWVLDWNMWAGAYEIWLDRKKRYQQAVHFHWCYAASASIVKTTNRIPSTLILNCQSDL